MQRTGLETNATPRILDHHKPTSNHLASIHWIGYGNAIEFCNFSAASPLRQFKLLHCSCHAHFGVATRWPTLDARKCMHQKCGTNNSTHSDFSKMLKWMAGGHLVGIINVCSLGKTRILSSGFFFQGSVDQGIDLHLHNFQRPSHTCS